MRHPRTVVFANDRSFVCPSAVQTKGVADKCGVWTTRVGLRENAGGDHGFAVVADAAVSALTVSWCHLLE